MNRYLKLPARFLLVLLGTILMSRRHDLSLAGTPSRPAYHGSDYFDVSRSNRQANTAYFSINSKL